MEYNCSRPFQIHGCWYSAFTESWWIDRKNFAPAASACGARARRSSISPRYPIRRTGTPAAMSRAAITAASDWLYSNSATP